ncbi:O-antigen ligase family protein [Gemmata sp. G18]|uniref:O-antigen ligase family protein n=1 Tax=Gemmata palustris TaxID=2822762 RepID=A0ABS5BZM2_9BACT|nr:O-antigen ligase family protein [Gemmata palustris]MBP3958348.1 O-antigen ligase family protein [Gemmata palustris]
MPVLVPALLHATALIVALLVQTTASPLAGAWVLFFIAGCAALLYRGDFRGSKPATWHFTLIWLVAISASAFLLAPVRGGAATLAILAAMPALALCLKREDLPSYFGCFGTVLAVYAAGLITQYALGVQYTEYNFNGVAWPLLNPNNAAAVLNCGLIPAFWAGFRNTKYWLLAILFAAALYCTQSFAGGASAIMACGLILIGQIGFRPVLALGAAGGSALAVLCLVSPGVYESLFGEAVKSFTYRFPIWGASASLLQLAPQTGLGLGSFAYYYAQVRTEGLSSGFYAHNDVLHLAVEAGIPVALIFCALAACVAISTRKHNVAPACALFVVFLQGMVEFQFYVPAVSILAGLTLAWHAHARKESLA